jgi:hypothetical protein
MATFRITHRGASGKKEDIEADDYVDEEAWITFRKLSPKPVQVLRIRAANVLRIDLVK